MHLRKLQLAPSFLSKQMQPVNGGDGQEDLKHRKTRKMIFREGGGTALQTQRKTQKKRKMMLKGRRWIIRFSDSLSFGSSKWVGGPG